MASESDFQDLAADADAALVDSDQGGTASAVVAPGAGFEAESAFEALRRADRLLARGEAALALQDYHRATARAEAGGGDRTGVAWRAARGAARAQLALGGLEAALSLWRRAAEMRPFATSELVEIAALALDHGHVETARALLAAGGAEALRVDAVVGCAALRLAAADGDAETAAALLALPEEGFGPAAAVPAAAHLADLGLDALAERVLGARLRGAPSAVVAAAAVAARSRALSALGREVEARATLTEGPSDDVEAAADLGPRRWASERARVIAVERAFRADGAEAARRFLALRWESAPRALAAARAEASDRARPVDLGAAGAVRAALVARAADAGRLARGAVTGLRWSTLLQARRDAASAILEAAVGPTGRRLAGAPPSVAGLLKRAPADWTLSEACFADAAALAGWISERIATGRPTAWVRLDEAAAAFGPTSVGLAHAARGDRLAVWRRWTGATGAPEADAARAAAGWLAEAEAAVGEGVAAADALGAPSALDLTLAAEALGDGALRRAFAAMRLAETRFAGDREAPPPALTAASGALDLNRWDLWATALAPAGSVDVIGAVDLAPALWERFGLSVATHYALPSSAAAAAALGTAVAGAGPGDRLPEAVAETLAALDGGRAAGRVHLISAGPFSGRVAARVKALGGIALDIGELAAAWAGWVSSDAAAEGLSFDAGAIAIEGGPLADRFGAGPFGAGGACRSDRSGRRNLSSARAAFSTPDRVGAAGASCASRAPTDPAGGEGLGGGSFWRWFSRSRAAVAARPSEATSSAVESSAPRRSPLGLIGAPDEGADLAAAALRASGVELGTATPGADGAAGWRWAVADARGPDGAETPALAFDAVVAVTRDPRAALPALLLSNADPAAFAFRRFHIARALGAERGVDVGRRRDPLERAALTLLYWSEIVDRCAPVATVRLERLGPDLRARAAEVAVAAPEIAERLAQLADMSTAAVATGPIEALIDGAEAGLAARLAASAASPERIRALPGAVLAGLEAYCRRHGYACESLYGG